MGIMDDTLCVSLDYKNYTKQNVLLISSKVNKKETAHQRLVTKNDIRRVKLSLFFHMPTIHSSYRKQSVNVIPDRETGRT